jgi:hypothetical protein
MGLAWRNGRYCSLCQDGGVTGANVPEISLEQASRSGARSVRDEDLPMLAAVWLTQGYDSEELRELAGMTRREARQAGRRLLAGVLSSLGWPMRDPPDADADPWLGYWGRISWALDEMDRDLAPDAVAQVVLEVAYEVPELWVPAGGDRLASLLRDWDMHWVKREQIDDQIREHLRSLRQEDA